MKRKFQCIAFSQNEEKFIFVGTTSADFFIIDHKNKTLVSVVSVGSLGVTQIISLSPEHILVGCGNGTLAKYSFDSKGWHLTSSLAVKSPIASLSATNKEVIVATGMPQALVINKQTFQPFLFQESHNAKINLLRFRDGDNNLFGAASDDGIIRLWDLASRTVKGRIEIGDQSVPRSFQIRADLLYAGWSDWSIKMHDINSGKMIWSIDKSHKGSVSAIDLSTNNKIMCTGGQDGTVRLWNLSTKGLLFSLQEHAGEITKVHLVPGDQHLFTSSKDKSIFLWNLEKQKRVQGFYHSFGSVNAFDVFGDGNSLLSTGQDRKISFWDIRTPAPVGR